MRLWLENLCRYRLVVLTSSTPMPNAQEAAAAATSKLGMGGGQGARGAGAKRPRGVAFGGVSDVNDMEG
jgi:hypothetical protein